NEIDNDDLDTNLLAQKVSNDLALTATTLRYANSPYYSTMIKVTTIQQAISLMGLSTVKKIIMMAALSGCFPENNCRGFSHKAFWRHSNAVGIAAKLIAKRLNFNADIAFTAGLLHDLGILVLVTQFPEQYASTIDYRNEHQVSQFEAERKVLGIDHAAVGEALAIEWNFSDTMKNAIAGHHHPEKPGLGFLATIIHVADGIAHVLGTTTTPDSQAVEVSALSWTSLNLDQASMDQLLEDTAEELVKLDSDE
ncbi:MAG: HDOD domain-containing protein, partial [Undibacterium sp.]|nr:HDOD domain-containing protein [Undibacterium sp.]